MFAPRPSLRACFALPALAACFSAEPAPLGVVEVETHGDISIEEGIGSESFDEATAWSVSFERFLVHVGAAGLGETSASAVPLADAPYALVDQVLPGSKVIVSAPDVVARRWGGFTFTMNPARAASILAGGATDEDRRAMQQKGASVRVKGTAEGRSRSGAPIAKTFDWWFMQVIAYGDCTSEFADAGTASGLLVRPANVNDVPLVFSARPLFDPILGQTVSPGRRLRFDPFADADTDSNGVITESELRRVKLSDLRRKPGLEAAAYESSATGSRSVVSLWDFLSEQVQYTVRFGMTGACTSKRYQ